MIEQSLFNNSLYSLLVVSTCKHIYKYGPFSKTTFYGIHSVKEMKQITILISIAVVGMVKGGLLAGAPQEQSPTDKRLQRMANFAVGELGSEYELVRVVSGTTQVVNGMLYNIELVARKVLPGNKNQRRRCKVLVYEIRHEGYLELEEFHCHFTKKAPRF